MKASTRIYLKSDKRQLTRNMVSVFCSTTFRLLSQVTFPLHNCKNRLVFVCSSLSGVFKECETYLVLKIVLYLYALVSRVYWKSVKLTYYWIRNKKTVTTRKRTGLSYFFQYILQLKHEFKLLPSTAHTGWLNLAELSWLYNHSSQHQATHPPTTQASMYQNSF